MRRWLILLAMLVCVPAGAQTIVTSPAPASVSVTLYRDPDREAGAINAAFPQGFALISEKRRLTLPAGASTIRFEGVAEGMIAVSAVVTGLPGGVVQKNRDARLLSPAALVDGTLGNHVHLRRTNPATGAVTEQDAVIRSTAANALVLETARGIEGLQCSGLPETLSFDGLPRGLSAKPVLSVDTQSANPATVEVTLTYLAAGFDWSAHYVARIAADGRTLDLFAWLTVANGDGGAFPQASLLAVAGRLNRQSGFDALQDAPPSPVLSLQCWPFEGYAAQEEWDGAGNLSIPVPAPAAMARMEEVVVTAQRRMAQQEELGDLKLYRVPMAVDLNPNAQKQVALLDQKGIRFDSYYIARLPLAGENEESQPLTRMIRFPNSRQNRAGVPLPSGGVAFFAPAGEESLLLGETALRDHAVGEMVKIEAGASPQLRIMQGRGKDDRHRRLTLTNATPDPAPVEIELQDDGAAPLASPSGRLQRRDGLWLWKLLVPANGTAQLDYRIGKRPD